MLPEDPPQPPRSFLDEEIATERFEARGLLVRCAIGFCMLFGLVFLAFWWTGSAVRFSADRVTSSNAPTYRIWGTVRDARSGQPVPWAVVEDDPAGQAPLFRTDADQNGAYSLLTLAEPHRLRISAVGRRTVELRIGKPWFVWWPRGEERLEIRLDADALQ